MIGQMVLIKEDFLPINTWPLGRILEVYHGSDGKPIENLRDEIKQDIRKIDPVPLSEGIGKCNSSDPVLDSSCHLPTSHRVHDKKNQ
ncbi:hypothetical protein TNCV_4188231 [Trichonephila clavipes]|nr:hypothetical protein TNCV_4188231 [Trichonephila clavipes]